MFKQLQRLLFGGPRKSAFRPNYFISTSGQSLERIKRLGLRTESQTMPGILDRGRLNFPVVEEETEAPEYKPDPDFYWIIEVEPGENKFFAKEELLKIFDREWRARFSAAVVYGYSLTTERWSYVSFDDSPERYGRLQIGIRLLKVYEPGVGDVEGMGASAGPALAAVPDLKPERLTGYLLELDRRMRRYPSPVIIREQESLAAAIGKARELATIKMQFGEDFVVVLKAESLYGGVLVWDTLTDAGLRWGDGDLFNWDNYPREYGGDQFFSVWTTSSPGYFFPESIKAGQRNFQDLLFGFWIARSADPVTIFDILMETVEFCRQRLGGVVLGRDGLPFDRERERARLIRLVEGLEAKGIRPGSDRALAIF